MPQPPHERRDPRIRSYVLPTRVVWHTEGKAKPEGVESLLGPERGFCMLTHQGEAPAIVFDFGRELHGGIRLEGATLSGPSPARVRVRLGETVAEVLQEKGEPFVWGADLLMPSPGTIEFGETGFRFARMELPDKGSEISLISVSGVHTRYGADRQGAFRCSDERLTLVWETGAHTVHLCMQDLLWNGIKRERHHQPDYYPTFAPVMAVFGADPIVPHTLDELQEYLLGDGPLDEFSTWELWWVLSQEAWYRFAGDEGYLSQQRDLLLAILKRACGCVGPDGREQIEERCFDVWLWARDPDENRDAVHAGLQGLTALALRAGAELCHALGETDTQVECQTAANLLRLHTPAPSGYKPANALLALAGLADVNTINDTLLRQDAARGFSPDAGYTVLQARAMAGDIEGGLELIRTYWGGMLDMGATSFWDYFDLDWIDGAGRIDACPVPERTVIQTRPGRVDRPIEFCASASAGPTAWLTEHVLGLKPVEPGCDAVMVNPNLAGLDWAEGALPTPHGVVRVRAEKTADGRTKIELDAPQSVRIVRG